MFKLNKSLRKLGIVSVSALMLLGVGAGVSSAHAHASGLPAGFSVSNVTPSKKEQAKDNILDEQGEAQERKAFIQGRPKDTSASQASKMFDLENEAKAFDQQHPKMNTSRLDKVMAGNNVHKMQTALNHYNAKAKRASSYKSSTKVVKQGNKALHHSKRTSMRKARHNDYKRVNHIKKQVRHAKKHAKRTSRNSALRKQIRSLKKQLRQIKSQMKTRRAKHSRRYMRLLKRQYKANNNQLHKLNRQLTKSSNKRANRKMSKHVTRHHAKRHSHKNY